MTLLEAQTLISNIKADGSLSDLEKCRAIREDVLTAARKANSTELKLIRSECITEIQALRP